MAESKGTVVTRNLVADYLDIGNSETPDIRVMSVFETIDENPNAQTTQKHYTADKSATTLTTGYQTRFQSLRTCTRTTRSSSSSVILARNRSWVSKQTISVFGCTSPSRKSRIPTTPANSA